MSGKSAVGEAEPAQGLRIARRSTVGDVGSLQYSMVCFNTVYYNMVYYKMVQVDINRRTLQTMGFWNAPLSSALEAPNRTGPRGALP